MLVTCITLTTKTLKNIQSSKNDLNDGSKMCCLRFIARITSGVQVSFKLQRVFLGYKDSNFV